MISTADPKLRPKNTRSAGRDFTRVLPPPAVPPDSPLVRDETVGLVLTEFFLEERDCPATYRSGRRVLLVT
jgi:hypothetical protein